MRVTDTKDRFFQCEALKAATEFDPLLFVRRIPDELSDIGETSAP